LIKEDRVFDPAGVCDDPDFMRSSGRCEVKYLFDSNVVIGLLRAGQALRARGQIAMKLVVSAVVYAEVAGIGQRQTPAGMKIGIFE
jgi:hypothetical protein